MLFPKFAFLNFQGIFIFSLVSYKPLEYNDYKYPVWGQVIGWCMAISSIVCIPGYMIFKFVTTEGTLSEVLFCTGFYYICYDFEDVSAITLLPFYIHTPNCRNVIEDTEQQIGNNYLNDFHRG